jgi:hypothetical protein
MCRVKGKLRELVIGIANCWAKIGKWDFLGTKKEFQSDSCPIVQVSGDLSTGSKQVGE